MKFALAVCMLFLTNLYADRAPAPRVVPPTEVTQARLKFEMEYEKRGANLQTLDGQIREIEKQGMLNDSDRDLYEALQSLRSRVLTERHEWRRTIAAWTSLTPEEALKVLAYRRNLDLNHALLGHLLDEKLKHRKTLERLNGSAREVEILSKEIWDLQTKMEEKREELRDTLLSPESYVSK